MICFAGRDILRRAGHIAFLGVVTRRDLAAEAERIPCGLWVEITTWPSVQVRVGTDATLIAERNYERALA
jgi:hypothetical protein